MNHPVCAWQAETVDAERVVDEGERVETKKRGKDGHHVNYGLKSHVDQ